MFRTNVLVLIQRTTTAHVKDSYQMKLESLMCLITSIDISISVSDFYQEYLILLIYILYISIIYILYIYKQDCFYEEGIATEL